MLKVLTLCWCVWVSKTDWRLLPLHWFMVCWFYFCCVHLLLWTATINFIIVNINIYEPPILGANDKVLSVMTISVLNLHCQVLFLSVSKNNPKKRMKTDMFTWFRSDTYMDALRPSTWLYWFSNNQAVGRKTYPIFCIQGDIRFGQLSLWFTRNSPRLFCHSQCPFCYSEGKSSHLYDS